MCVVVLVGQPHSSVLPPPLKGLPPQHARCMSFDAKLTAQQIEIERKRREETATATAAAAALLPQLDIEVDEAVQASSPLGLRTCDDVLDGARRLERERRPHDRCDRI